MLLTCVLAKRAFAKETLVKPLYLKIIYNSLKPNHLFKPKLGVPFHQICYPSNREQKARRQRAFLFTEIEDSSLK